MKSLGKELRDFSFYEGFNLSPFNLKIDITRSLYFFLNDSVLNVVTPIIKLRICWIIFYTIRENL